MYDLIVIDVYAQGVAEEIGSKSRALTILDLFQRERDSSTEAKGIRINPSRRECFYSKYVHEKCTLKENISSSSVINRRLRCEMTAHLSRETFDRESKHRILSKYRKTIVVSRRNLISLESKIRSESWITSPRIARPFGKVSRTFVQGGN